VTLLIAQGRNKDGSQVAVKKLTKSSKQGKREFLEDVINLSKVQHKNLVKLRGFCVERKHRLLVYEYLEKKSLRRTLLGNLQPLRLDLVESYNSMGIIHCYDVGMLRTN
jgi:serine/threonine protein kinase